MGDIGLNCIYCGRHLTYDEMRDPNCFERECQHCDDWPEDACEELKDLRQRIVELEMDLAALDTLEGAATLCERHGFGELEAEIVAGAEGCLRKHVHKDELKPYEEAHREVTELRAVLHKVYNELVTDSRHGGYTELLEDITNILKNKEKEND